LASETEGIHAYELDRRLRVLSQGFWTPYSGEVSRTLHQLEDEGDISSQWQMQDGRPKRVFTAARSGVDRLDVWLHTEITAEPRPLHEKLWHRFVAHKARKRDPAELVRDIRIRRAASLEQLRRLEEHLAATTGTEAYAAFSRVALRVRQFEWQAELGILDELERELANDGKADRMGQATPDAIDRRNGAEDAADRRVVKRGHAPRGKERALA
jgi:DNA-binding PadR family transcriptional regulator